MSAESERKTQIKEILKKLRSERAADLKKVQDRLKDTALLRNKIRKALREEPRTVPRLAECIGESTDRILWMLMEMRTYGMVAEDEQDGDYFKYRLIPLSKKGA